MAFVVFCGGALVAEDRTCEATRDCKAFLILFARILSFTIFYGF